MFLRLNEFLANKLRNSAILYQTYQEILIKLISKNLGLILTNKEFRVDFYAESKSSSIFGLLKFLYIK